MPSAEHGRWVLPSGLPALDAVLPGGGFEPASVIECHYAAPGVGATTLALCIAASAARKGGQAYFQAAPQHEPVILIDADGDFYPPAVAHWGIDPRRLIVIKPPNLAEACWAAEQALRCRAVGAVVAFLPALEETWSRRLQLAAESGLGLGVMVTPAKARRRSFAAVRMLVEGWPSGGGPRRVRVTLIRVREGMPADPVVVELPDETDPLSVHAEPADRPADECRRQAAG